MGKSKLSGNHDIGTGGGNYNENIGKNYIQAQHVTIIDNGQYVQGEKYIEQNQNISELIVSPFGKADDRSVNEAVKNAVAGTSILVRPGVWLLKKGEVTIDNCDIFANNLGVVITEASYLAVTNCQINFNKIFAIGALENSQVTIKNCNLTNNDRGAWGIDDSCLVTRSNNITD